MTDTQILHWLRETDESHLGELWRQSDQTRRQHVGDEVHLRGLIELSNHCVRQCTYCGLRAENAKIARYRLTEDEVLQCVHRAVGYGYGSVVLQSGEDPGITVRWMSALIRQIKAETSLAVTLSLGERSEHELAAWRDAGADRYLLRFETSNRQLYERIHPPRNGERSDRIAILGTLRRLGYEVGSGVMIGIPGQSYSDLALDIELFAELGLDMVGVGPYLAHPETPLGRPDGDRSTPPDKQVPNDELTTYKVIALTRLVCPRSNIPSTTALATLNRTDGRQLGLVRGANVIMPNLTPSRYRALYEIYPDKACIAESDKACHACVRAKIRSMGRHLGVGRGDSRNYTIRHRS